MGLSLEETQTLFSAALADGSLKTATVIMDLNQNPGHMLTTTGAVPCLLSKHQVYSLRLQRGMVKEESLLVQGFDTLGIQTRWRPSWIEEVKRLTSSQVQDLAGNAIHGHVACSVLAWAFAHMCRRNEAPAKLLKVKHERPDEEQREQARRQTKRPRCVKKEMKAET